MTLSNICNIISYISTYAWLGYDLAWRLSGFVRIKCVNRTIFPCDVVLLLRSVDTHVMYVTYVCIYVHITNSYPDFFWHLPKNCGILCTIMAVFGKWLSTTGKVTLTLKSTTKATFVISEASGKVNIHFNYNLCIWKTKNCNLPREIKFLFIYENIAYLFQDSNLS